MQTFKCFGLISPGILIAKKRLFKNSVPSGCGGGSVFFVSIVFNVCIP